MQLKPLLRKNPGYALAAELVRYSRAYRFRLQSWRHQRAGEKLRVVLGAGDKFDAGWLPTDKKVLNIVQAKSWKRCFAQASIDALLAEHVWEHLSENEGRIAAELCFRYLKPGAYLRIAVPDGLHPDPAYIEWVRPGGSGPGAQSHLVLYTYETLRDLFEKAGFHVALLEYFDAQGVFHEADWTPADGTIHRSRRFDARNQDGRELNYTSIILDAIKPDSA